MQFVIKQHYKQFKDKHTFQDRLNDSDKIKIKYPYKLPIVCEKNTNDSNIPDITKHKYLVDYYLTVGQFMYTIKQHIPLKKEQAIFLFVGNNIPSFNNTIGDLYHKYKDLDGFLYIHYSIENTFG